MENIEYLVILLGYSSMKHWKSWYRPCPNIIFDFPLSCILMRLFHHYTKFAWLSQLLPSTFLHWHCIWKMLYFYAIYVKPAKTNDTSQLTKSRIYNFQDDFIQDIHSIYPISCNYLKTTDLNFCIIKIVPNLSHVICDRKLWIHVCLKKNIFFSINQANSDTSVKWSIMSTNYLTI